MTKNYRPLFIAIFLTVCSCNFAFAADVFNVINFPNSMDVNVGEEVQTTLQFTYTGTSTKLKVSILNNNVAKTGLKVSDVSVGSSGIDSVVISGTPTTVGTYKLGFFLTDFKSNNLRENLDFNVKGLNFATTTLPTAYGLFKTYTAEVPYTYTGKYPPVFSFDFPVRFGAVNTDSSKPNVLQISFVPSFVGKYKFRVSATNGRNSALLTNTELNLTIANEKDKPKEKIETPTPINISTATKTATTSKSFFKKIVHFYKRDILGIKKSTTTATITNPPSQQTETDTNNLQPTSTPTPKDKSFMKQVFELLGF